MSSMIDPATSLGVERQLRRIEDIATDRAIIAEPRLFAAFGHTTNTTHTATAEALNATTDVLTAISVELHPHHAHHTRLTTALANAVNAYCDHVTAGLTNTLRVRDNERRHVAPADPHARTRTRIVAADGAARRAHDIALLVSYPHAAPLMRLLDDIQNAYATGASTTRLATAIRRPIATGTGHLFADHYAAFLAAAHHHALLIASSNLHNHETHLNATAHNLMNARRHLAAIR